MMDPTLIDPSMFHPGGGAATSEPDVTTTDIQLVGRGHHKNTTEDISRVKQFADNLRASVFFDKDGVQITELPSPMLTEDDEFFSFSITARLTNQSPE